ncbi:MAG: pantoate--beta-alanine ligase [Polyangiales bacterium]|jgi:pantoate--beta-alanine ligase
MKILRTKDELRAACNAARASGQRVGFVPTMGALHAGHTSLMDAAAREGADYVVTSIFVNPLQFAAGEDLDQYPRTFDADIAACEAHGVHAVFAPEKKAMYGAGFSTEVKVSKVTAPFDGQYRPEHFDGVTTVVAKLFNVVGESLAVFGRKDFQQWRTLERMTQDLDLPVVVLGEPIIREHDGLALSSRNRYLSDVDRERALALSQGLRRAEAAWESGERNPEVLVAVAREPVEGAFDRIDYVGAADPFDLGPPEPNPTRLVLLAAAHLGHTRLIDNIELGPKIDGPKRT